MSKRAGGFAESSEQAEIEIDEMYQNELSSDVALSMVGGSIHAWIRSAEAEVGLEGLAARVYALEGTGISAAARMEQGVVKIIATARDWRELGCPESQRRDQNAPRAAKGGESLWPALCPDPKEAERARALIEGCQSLLADGAILQTPERVQGIKAELDAMDPKAIAGLISFAVAADMFSVDQDGRYIIAALFAPLEKELSCVRAFASLDRLLPAEAHHQGWERKESYWGLRGVSDPMELAIALMARGFVWDPVFQEGLNLMEYDGQVEPSGTRGAMHRLTERRWLEGCCAQTESQRKKPRV